MTFGEAFIDIVVRGGKEAKDQLGAAHGALKSIGSSSFATKAAILGVVYGLERMTEFAANAGADLNKFAAATGLSTRQLQEWQHVGIKYGVQRDEIKGTISQLQALQTQFKMTGQMPATAGLLGVDLGKGDPFELFSKLVEKAKELGPARAQFALAPFGITPNVLAMMERANFQLDRMGAHVSSDKELAALQRTRTGYDQFWESLQNLNMRLTSEFGPTIVDTLQHAFHGIKSGIDDVEKLNKQFKATGPILGGLATAIGLAFAPLTTIVVGLGLAIADLDKGDKSWLRQNAEKLTGGLDFTASAGGDMATMGARAPMTLPYGPVAPPGLQKAELSFYLQGTSTELVDDIKNIVREELGSMTDRAARTRGGTSGNH